VLVLGRGLEVGQAWLRSQHLQLVSIAGELWQRGRDEVQSLHMALGRLRAKLIGRALAKCPQPLPTLNKVCELSRPGQSDMELRVLGEGRS
jgi:hypothetical protein